MKMYWLISDTHFGHTTLVERGWRPADFERKLEANLVRSVTAPDTLIHLGDVAITAAGIDRWREITRRLECRKLLIRGNHDKKSLTYYAEAGWDCVSDGVILDIFGKRAVLTHEPLDRVDPWDINIHGHLHLGVHRGDVMADGKHILISMEHLQYRPIPLRTVIELAATPEFVGGRFRGLGDGTPFRSK